MKTTTVSISLIVSTLLYIVALPTFAWIDAEELDEDTAFALPMQANYCEIAGVGNVIGTTTNGFIINVNTWWWNGNSATNPLHVAVKENTLVSTNVPIVFLASTVKYDIDEWPFNDRLRSIYSFMFKMDEMNQYTNLIQRGELRLIDDERSWFRADEENGKLLAYTSNLVHYAKVDTNLWAFYKTIRNSAGDSGKGTKVYYNSFCADLYWAAFFSDEMAERVLRAKFQDGSGGIADCVYINRFGTNILHEIRMSEPVR